MIREGYRCKVKNYTGGYNGGILTVWKIDTPSGEKYEILKNSKSGNASLKDGYGITIIGSANNFNEAMKEIYKWENAGISKNPNLKSETVILQLLNGPHYWPSVVKTLEEFGSIKLNLQTAVYLFESHFNTWEKNRYNLTNLDSILRTFNLEETETIILCRYAISRDPKCIESFPKNLMSEAVKDGSIQKLVTPSGNGINPEWLISPCFGKDVVMDMEDVLEERE